MDVVIGWNRGLVVDGCGVGMGYGVVKCKLKTGMKYGG
jgi:hypothetical protein